MTLFHFIRYVLDITPIALFDIEGNLIKKFDNKQAIDIDLLDYQIFRVSAMQSKEYFDNKCYICIMLQK